MPDKFVDVRFQGEDTYFFTLHKFQLSPFKIIVYIQTFQIFCDGISISILLLLDNFNQLLQHISPPLINNHYSRKITKKMVCICIDRIQIPKQGKHLKLKKSKAIITLQTLFRHKKKLKKEDKENAFLK